MAEQITRLYHLTDDETAIAMEDRLALTLPGGDGAETAALANRLFAAGHYRHVADIRGDRVTAFQATQNGVDTDSWSREPVDCVTPTQPNTIEYGGRQLGRRSTSVGDIFEVNGERVMIAGFGYLKL